MSGKIRDFEMEKMIGEKVQIVLEEDGKILDNYATAAVGGAAAGISTGASAAGGAVAKKY